MRGHLEKLPNRKLQKQGYIQRGGFSSGTTPAGIILIIHPSVSAIKPVTNFKYEALNGEVTSQVSKRISIEEFQEKYLSDVAEKDIWLNFNADLRQEVEDGKISKIKYHRIISKLTQKELAEKMKTSQPNIVRLEGVGYKTKISISTLKKLGKIFNVDFKELIE